MPARTTAATATNTAAVRRTFDELFTRGDLALADELVTADFVDHEAPPGTPPGPEGLRRLVGTLRTAFPDLRCAVEDVVAAGDRVAVRLTLRGRHLGALPGLPAPERRVAVEVMEILRLADGKVAERWGVVDRLGMLQQLGAGPAPIAAHER